MVTFNDEVERLAPLLRAAEDAHRHHQSHRKGGTAYAGIEAAKKTETFEKNLSSFWDAQHRLEAAERAILESVRAGNREGVSSALAYLSIRQRPFRSGYMSLKLARALKKIPLGDADRHLLRGILLDRLTWPWSQPRDLWRLIPLVRTPDLFAAMEVLTDDDRNYVKERALAVLGRFGPGSRSPGRSI